MFTNSFFGCRNGDRREGGQRRGRGGKHYARLRCRPRLRTGAFSVSLIWANVPPSFPPSLLSFQQQCPPFFRTRCRLPATYRPHPAWFPPPLTFPAPRHSQVRRMLQCFPLNSDDIKYIYKYRHKITLGRLLVC